MCVSGSLRRARSFPSLVSLHRSNDIIYGNVLAVSTPSSEKPLN